MAETLRDYDDMVLLMKSPEWRSWVKFLRERKDVLRDKVLEYVRNSNFGEAQKVLAIHDDTEKQILLFINKKKDLEEELDNKEEVNG